MDKQEVLRMIEALPGDATLEDILYHLYVVVRIEGSLEDIRQGRVVSHEQVMREITELLHRSAPRA